MKHQNNNCFIMLSRKAKDDHFRAFLEHGSGGKKNTEKEHRNGFPRIILDYDRFFFDIFQEIYARWMFWTILHRSKRTLSRVPSGSSGSTRPLFYFCGTFTSVPPTQNLKTKQLGKITDSSPELQSRQRKAKKEQLRKTR